MARFKYIFFDCDGVLIKGDSWPKLHKAVGLPDKTDQEWFEEYYAGKIDYIEWNRRIENYYLEQKVTRDLVEKVIFDYQLLAGVEETVALIRKRGIQTAMLSTGIDVLIGKVGLDLEIEEWRTNTKMKFNKENKLENIIIDYPDEKCKAIYIKEICRNEGIKPEETMFVGDSVVDKEAFEITQHGVLMGHARPELKQYSWKQIDKINKIIKLIDQC